MHYLICDKCYKVHHMRYPGTRCDFCEAGKLLDIDAYVDFTSVMTPPLTLYRHPDSLTLFTEKGFFDKFEINACRVISEDYIVDMPQFLRVYPLDSSKMTLKEMEPFVEEAKKKIAHYNFIFGSAYNLSDM